MIIQNLKKENLLKETKQKEREFIKEGVCNKFNRGIENSERIHNEHSKEVKGLKTQIRYLKLIENGPPWSSG